MGKHIPEFTLITQNVDGYHIQAGSKKVLELHGNIQRVKCFDGCGVVEDWEETAPPSNLPCKRERDCSPPVILRCPKCDAYLRPDVVWFGENLLRNILEEALHAAQNCQVSSRLAPLLLYSQPHPWHILPDNRVQSSLRSTSTLHRSHLRLMGYGRACNPEAVSMNPASKTGFKKGPPSTRSWCF
jgi:hypothetical protein